MHCALGLLLLLLRKATTTTSFSLLPPVLYNVSLSVLQRVMQTWIRKFQLGVFFYPHWHNRGLSPVAQSKQISGARALVWGGSRAPGSRVAARRSSFMSPCQDKTREGEGSQIPSQIPVTCCRRDFPTCKQNESLWNSWILVLCMH